MHKNQRLDVNMITPTTKADDGDRPISPQEIVESGRMSEEDWSVVAAAALRLFAFGQSEVAKRGLLLVDTKYEFGVAPDGTIMLIDEIHTPDSSRYWIADSYLDRIQNGMEPENIDKEFLRLWFRDNCDDPYSDDLPEAPKELVGELAKRYIYLFETITGKEFKPDANFGMFAKSPQEKLKKELTESLKEGKWKAELKKESDTSMSTVETAAKEFMGTQAAQAMAMGAKTPDTSQKMDDDESDSDSESDEKFLENL